MPLFYLLSQLYTIYNSHTETNEGKNRKKEKKQRTKKRIKRKNEREREREKSSVKSIPSKPKPINQSSFLTLIITAALSVYQAVLLRLPFPTTRFSRNSHVTRLIKALDQPLCPPLKKPPLG